MSQTSSLKAFLPIVGLFTVINIAGKVFQQQLVDWKIDPIVVLIGNLILFVASAVSYYFFQKSINNKQPYTFLNYIYAGMFFKMILCLLSAFFYIRMAGKEVSKPAIFVTMFLYLVYTFVELRILLKLSKQQKHG